MDKLEMPDTAATSRPFTEAEVTATRVNRIAIGLGVYVFLVLLPGYEWLRYLWDPTYDLFALPGVLTAGLIAILFSIFARRTMRRYFSLGR